MAELLRRPSMTNYLMNCQAFGVDPAAFLDDDVLAAQFRAGASFLESKQETKDGAVADFGAWVRKQER
jgi:hypothetical protein